MFLTMPVNIMEMVLSSWVGLVQVVACVSLGRKRVNTFVDLKKAQVSMDRWCISLEDLKQFKRLVCQAVAAGRICPTESLGCYLYHVTNWMDWE